MAKKKRFIDYPRWGRTGVRRWLPSWRLILGTVVGVVVLAVASLAAAVALVQVPEPNDVARAQVTTFYWNDGTTVLGKMSETNRTNVDLADVPKPVQQAVLAAEDRDFYDHGGFSPSGLVRAFWNNFSGGSTQGASTITQQYTKNAFLTRSAAMCAR
jgi:membrane peptidoglycan carboxypeptidase